MNKQIRAPPLKAEEEEKVPQRNPSPAFSRLPHGTQVEVSDKIHQDYYGKPSGMNKQIRAPPLKAEEDHSEDKMNELYSFVQWILDRDNSPSKQSYAQLKAQYDVEKFAERAEEEKVQESEMEKPARFQAEPPCVGDTPTKFKAPDERK
jgi:hypothetical protein